MHPCSEGSFQQIASLAVPLDQDPASVGTDFAFDARQGDRPARIEHPEATTKLNSKCLLEFIKKDFREGGGKRS
jgi:hypothetical protein